MSVLTNATAPRLHWDGTQAIPHSCSVCGFLLRDAEDFQTSKKFGTCTECADTYYYPNAEAWEKGWRPKLEEKK